MGSTKWYYAVDGKRIGPFTSAELREEASAGRLLPRHHVWKDGLEKWFPAEKVKGLFEKPTPAISQPDPDQTVPPPPVFKEEMLPAAERGEPTADVVRNETQCPYCGEVILAVARKCKHCGEFLDGSQKKKGKAIFKASRDFIGLMCSYHIMDSRKNVLAKLKPGQSFDAPVESDTTMFVWYSCGFGGPVSVKCNAAETNRFSIGLSQMGLGCVVSRVDVLDSD